MAWPAAAATPSATPSWRAWAASTRRVRLASS